MSSQVIRVKIQLKKFDKALEKRKMKALYISAFPPEERPAFQVLMRRLGKPFVDCYSIYCDDEWAGFTYVVNYNRLSYVFFLAISDSHRGKGIGSEVLSKLKDIYKNQSLLLAIEEVDESYDNYAQRISRRNFYNRNGFNYYGYKIVEGRVTYDALSTDKDFDPDDYERLFKRYAGRVLASFLKTKMYKYFSKN